MRASLASIPALLAARSVARLGGPDDLFPRALAGLHRLCRC